jgi:SAM-dependent methyltransferase
VTDKTAFRSSIDDLRNDAGAARSMTDLSPSPPPCPICRSAAIALAKIVEGFRIWRCGDCGLFWVPGVSDAELQGFYESEYFVGSHQYGYADYVATEHILRGNARSLLKFIRRRGRVSGEAVRLVDVGSAHGFLVDEACKAGFDASGVDCSEEAVRYAQNVLGRKVTLGSLPQAGFPAASFDVVTSIGSIEHFNDPIAIVEEAARICKKGGLFVVTTLDTAFLTGIFRFKPPEHLYYFSRRNLSMLLDARGFEVEIASVYYARHAVGEIVGLAAKLLLGSIINLDPALAKLPLRNLSIALPNNEMLVVARRR